MCFVISYFVFMNFVVTCICILCLRAFQSRASLHSRPLSCALFSCTLSLCILLSLCFIWFWYPQDTVLCEFYAVWAYESRSDQWSKVAFVEVLQFSVVFLVVSVVFNNLPLIYCLRFSSSSYISPCDPFKAHHSWTFILFALSRLCRVF